VTDPLDITGVYANGPVRELRPGEVFTVGVFARSPSASIKGFQLGMRFDARVVAFAGVAVSSNFKCAP